MVEYLDSVLGRLFDFLAATGLDQSTRSLLLLLLLLLLLTSLGHGRILELCA
jgi:hypothetical protein